jgi:hypothetical protein
MTLQTHISLAKRDGVVHCIDFDIIGMKLHLKKYDFLASDLRGF